MINTQTYFIPSCDDSELRIKRESLLELKLTYDEDKDTQAVLCIISGLGGDIKDDMYMSQYCARNYSVAVLNVNYHGIGNRPQTGAEFYIDEIDKTILQASLEALGIALPIAISNLKSYEEFYCVCDAINKFIERLKKSGELSEDYLLYLSLGLKPARNEYQNYGIMQAMDILNALLYVKNHIFKNAHLKTILVGASHGGYLAHLCAKIAPWNVDFIVDNSSAVSLNNDLWRFIGFGKELDYIKYCSVAINYIFKNIKFAAFDKTYWTSNSQSPYYFSKSRKLIRESLNEEHLNLQATYPKTSYIIYHSKFDQYVPLEEKQRQVDILQKLGFRVEFFKITDEKEVDGKFIKNLTHGMGIPMKLIIKKHLKPILEQMGGGFTKLRGEALEEKLPRDYKKEIHYKSDDLIYSFKEEKGKILLSITKSNSIF